MLHCQGCEVFDWVRNVVSWYRHFLNLDFYFFFYFSLVTREAFGSGAACEAETTLTGPGGLVLCSSFFKSQPWEAAERDRARLKD